MDPDLDPHPDPDPDLDPELVTAIVVELRRFVAAAGTRRALPVSCHVGRPGGEAVHLPEEGALDPGLRADLVERALDGLESTTGACAWVTRGGEPGRTDADAAWYAAARWGFARHGVALPAFFVLDRRGWTDLVSGQERRWRRVRSRAAASAG